ncbi:MAG: right-handed parallel beta-helix repeat-containing protein [Actinomycetota bacterium]
MRRTIAVSVVTALAVMLLPGVARPAEFVVDDGGTEPCDFGTATFQTISDAVLAAPAGSTINVCPGTYPEQLVIRKSLTLVGSGDDSVISTPEALASVSIDSVSYQALIRLDSPAPGLIDVILDDLRIDGGHGMTGLNATGVLFSNVDGVIKDSSIVDIGPAQGSHNRGFAIRLVKGADVEISGNEVTGYQRAGVTIDGDSAGNVHDNTFQGSSPDPAGKFGIQIADPFVGAAIDSVGAVVERNVLLDHRCTASTCGPDGGSQFQSLGVVEFEGIDSAIVRNNDFFNNDISLQITDGTAEGNTIIGGDVGIYVRGDSSLISNEISNTGVGIDIANRDATTPLAVSAHEGNVHDNGTGVVVRTAGGPVAASVRWNRIFGNGRDSNAVGDALGADPAGLYAGSGTVVSFEGNWWGCNEGPNLGDDCDTSVGQTPGSGWAQIGLTSSHDTLEPEESATLSARLTVANTPPGLVVDFTTDLGEITQEDQVIEDPSGADATLFNPGVVGTAHPAVLLDAERVETTVVMKEAEPEPTPTETETPEPTPTETETPEPTPTESVTPTPSPTSTGNGTSPPPGPAPHPTASPQPEPTVGPGGDPEPEVAETTLSLRYRPRRGFRGSVFSTDDSCIATRRVVLRKKVDGVFRRRGAVYTARDGSWRIARSPRRWGRWQAIVFERKSSALSCTGAQSQVLTVAGRRRR